MSNMSYCRFYNTSQDLSDCYDNLFDQLDSADEIRARRQLIETCADILDRLCVGIDADDLDRALEDLKNYEGDDEE